MLNTATYVVRHPEYGWLAFGGDLRTGRTTEEVVRVEPRDAARARVYLAPVGLWLTLDAGTFERVELSAEGVRLTLAPATAATAWARLRIEQPADIEGVGGFSPVRDYERERGAWVIPLHDGATTQVTLRTQDQGLE